MLTRFGPGSISSDAVLVVRLDDGVTVDVNEALFSMTGYRGDDLIGRSSHEFLTWTTVAPGLGRAGGLRELESVGDVPAGFRTRTGDLRVGDLSVPVIPVEGGRHAVCTLRAGLDPTAAERRAIARLVMRRVLRDGGGWQAMAEAAVRVVGECRCRLREVLGLLELVSRAVRDRDRMDLLLWLGAQLGAAGGLAEAGGEGGGLPAGLTLKAVSERTGIPAATVRTWERRYHFIHPQPFLQCLPHLR